MDTKNPSFSSTLLDKIYRSIDEGERKSTATAADTKFYTQTLRKKHSRGVAEEERELLSVTLTTAKQKTDRKWSRYHEHHHEQDVLFFSSTSSSSDSSSGLLSSSDTESVHRVRSSRVSCFLPNRPKPVRTSDAHVGMNSDSNEEGLIKSKSRALRIYNNLKKVKQPISPGGKLTNFLNSLLGNAKKPTKPASSNSEDAKLGQGSTCSSASSFSRSCMSKSSLLPPSRDTRKVKRTVRFYPVSVIVDEDSKPCGHKCLCEGEDTRRLMSVAVPTAWKIHRSNKKNEVDEAAVDKSKRVEEAAREFLKEYRRNERMKSDLVLRGFRNENGIHDEDDDDDDAGSCSSSDLFELDHLAVMGISDRFCEELPVYETTRVSANRAISNGLLL